MAKKIVAIWYRYDDMTIDYIDNVKEVSVTSVINFTWVKTALTKLKLYLS
jgi:hypothetical protein